MGDIKTWPKFGSTVRGAVHLVGLAALLATSVFVLLNATPVGQLRVTMSITTTEPGLSQLFFSREGEPFSENRSQLNVVRTGANELSFPVTVITGGLGSPLRWDPLDIPAQMTLSRAEIRGLFVKTAIPLEAFVSQLDVLDPRLEDDALSFTTGSNDPQMLVAADLAPAARANLIHNALVASFVGALIAALWHLSTGWRERLRRSPVSNWCWRPQAPAAWMLMLAGVIVVLNTAMLIIGSLRIGAMWDGRSIVDRTNFYLFGGWFIEKYGFEEGLSAMGDTFVYGPVNGLWPHFVAVLAGQEPLLGVSHSAGAYAARNLAIAFLAVAGSSAVAVSARLLLGSWRWALVAGALVSSIPAWTGQGMFNVKDVPVAAGYSLVTLSLIALVRLPSRRRGIWWLFVLSFTSGVILAVGTRPGMWAPLTLSVLLVLVALLTVEWSDSGKEALGRAFYRGSSLLAAASISYGVLLILYPRGFGRPADILVQSVTASAKYPIDIPTLTAGEVVWSSEPLWYYLPLWIAAQTPILIGLLALALAPCGWFIIRRHADSDLSLNAVQWSPVLLQALLVPVASTVLGSTVFNGARHVLFLFPAIGLLAAGGAAFALASVRSSVVMRRVAAVVVAAAMVAPTVSQVRLFPFNFVYVNPAVALGDIDMSWEMDFQAVSGREILSLVPRHKYLSCDDEVLTGEATCDSEATVSPYLADYFARPRDGALGDDEVIVLHQDTYGAPVSQDCERLTAVERSLHGQTVTLFTAYRCPLAP